MGWQQSSRRKGGRQEPLSFPGEKRMLSRRRFLTAATGAGYPAIESIGSGRMGVFVSARTPAATIAALSKAVSAACALETVKADLAKLGLDPLEASPSELAQLVASETQHWAEAVKASGFKPME
jgi:tripartite-type tricarboxylate transporter receptor subunit TctC